MQPAVVQVTRVIRPRDAHSVRGARGGDIRAFEAIVADQLPAAFRLAAAILGDEAEAADATQNALVAAWRELPRLRDCAAFDAWFHRILVNECRMQVRRRTRLREMPLDTRLDDRPESEGSSAITKVEILDELETAFEQLDAEDRAMVVMHHLEDRPLAEIAAAMHMPVGTVKWRLHEARGVLQRALEAVR